jgi:Family of unknown function (DUF6161)
MLSAVLIMPTTKLPPIFTLKFEQTKNQVVLVTLKDVAQWYSTERTFWNWLQKSEIQQDPKLRSISEGWLGFLNRGLSGAEEIANNPTHAQFQNLLNNLRENTNSLLRWYLPSNSPEASFINEIVESPAGPQTAAAALATLSRWPSLNDNGNLAREFKSIEGAVMARLFREGVSPSANVAIKESIERTIGELSERTSIVKSDYNKFSLEQERWSEEYRSTARQDADHANEERTQTMEQLRNDFGAIKNELEAVRKTYEEHMTLEGPVKYWKDRSTTHNDRFRFFVGGLGAAVAISIVFVGCVYSWVAGKILGELKSDHLLYAALALLASTAALWLVRVVLKILLSERHLRNNAEEKAMMIQTYLAMTKVGEASKEDRQIVLAAIFNTSADGIVKDDGAPDTSMAAILSKYFLR